ncbi:MAG TPA: response regulator [Methylomirabilota bacterium]|jgi:CheY-like chemotaxis protein
MSGELILVIEDNDKNRKLVRDVLAQQGYRLAEAETGEEGVRLARDLRPDLILMDIQLPGIDGVTALGQIRADPALQHTPVIAVTASAMSGDRRRIMEAGFDAYESKPISVRPFLDTVRQTLDRRRPPEEGRP